MSTYLLVLVAGVARVALWSHRVGPGGTTCLFPVFYGQDILGRFSLA